MASEKEKMISGELYNPNVPELIADRNRAKELCQRFNRLESTKQNKLNQLLKEILQKETNIIILPNFFCDYGYNIEAGENIFINHNCVILDCAKVKIGNNVLVEPNCGFYTACHPLVARERNTIIEYAKPITIGNNVWIGGNVTILPGVTIGDNAVIGAGSVVTKDVPSNIIAAGNPCKVLREITDNDLMGIC